MCHDLRFQSVFNAHSYTFLKLDNYPVLPRHIQWIGVNVVTVISGKHGWPILMLLAKYKMVHHWDHYQFSDHCKPVPIISIHSSAASVFRAMSICLCTECLYNNVRSMQDKSWNFTGVSEIKRKAGFHYACVLA